MTKDNVAGLTVPMEKNSFLLKFIYIVLFYFIFVFSVHAECSNPNNQLVVLLKFDDVSDDVDPRKNAKSARNWERVTEFLETNGIAASYGVIGSSFEIDNEKYFEWIKARQRNGVIEFWNHGYDNHFSPDQVAGEVGEFNGTSAEKQVRSISRTQNLVRQKTGIVLHGFGPHFSAVDKNTFDQLDSIPEINYVWFYKPVDQNVHRQFIIQRVVELEAPIFHPNFEAFLKTFANRNRSLAYIAMQGHPWSWDDGGFDSFVRTISWLRGQNVVFCRPSEFLKLEN